MASRAEISRRRLLAGAGRVAGGLALGLGVRPAVAQGQKSVRIGAIHPVSCVLAQIGQACRQGAQLAVDQINKAGGIRSKGTRLELLVGDSESKP